MGTDATDNYDIQSDNSFVLEEKTYNKDESLKSIYSGRVDTSTITTNNKLFSYSYYPRPYPAVVSGSILGLELQSVPDVSIMSGGDTKKSVTDHEFDRYLKTAKEDFADLCSGCNIYSGAKKPSKTKNVTLRTNPTTNTFSASPEYEKQVYTTSNNVLEALNTRETYNSKVAAIARRMAEHIIKTGGKHTEINPDMFFNAIAELKINNLTVPEIQEVYTVTTSQYKSLLSNDGHVELTPFFRMDFSTLTDADKSKLIMFEEFIVNNGYMEVIERSKYQSSMYKGLGSILNRSIDRKREHNLHPLFVAFFGTKLPLIEETFVRGDSYLFLRQKLHRSNMLRSDNYDLFLNRLSDVSPMYILGSENLMEAELRYVHMHALLRRVIMDLRQGTFHSKHSDQLIVILKRCMPAGYHSIMSEEELLVSALLGLGGVKPSMLIYPRLVNGLVSTDMKVCPMIYYTPRNSRFPVNTLTPNNLGAGPQAINNETMTSLVYQPHANKIVWEQSNYHDSMSVNMPLHLGVSATSPGLLSQFASGNMFNNQNRILISHGVIIYCVQRRITVLDSKLGMDKFGVFKSYIRSSRIEISPTLTLNEEKYHLMSVMCHRLSKAPHGTLIDFDAQETEGFRTYVRKERTYTDDEGALVDKTHVADRLYGDYDGDDGRLANEGFPEFHRYDPYDEMYSDQEHTTVRDYLAGDENNEKDIKENCFLLIYSMDYTKYQDARNYAQLNLFN